MANIISYTRNLTKSIKYSTIDAMKDMNPVITGFYKNNQSILQETYKAIKDIKGYAKESDQIRDFQSKYGGLAKDFYENLREDLRSGKFYNKERIEKVEGEIAAQMSGLDDFDFGLEDTFETSSSSSIDDTSLDFSDLDTVAEKSTTAVGEIMARTAQYQVEAQRQSTKAMLDQNSAIFGKLNTSIGVVNSNLAMVVNYMKENSTTHYNNSKDYYENSTRMHQETNEMLRELLELEKNRYKQQNSNNKSKRKKEFSDLFMDGALDLQAYAEMVKENIEASSSGLGDMISMAVEQGLLKSMTASPMKAVTDTLVKTVIPKVLKDSMQEFNKSLEGAFSSAIMKITSLEDSDSSILSAIGRMFGFHGSLKKNIDTSKYEKGAVPFDGVTRKAIIDVIPTYLSKIYSAVSGKEERRYNYDTGKYVKVSDLKKELQNMFDSQVYSSTADVQRSFRDMKKSVNFKGSKQREEEFDKDMKAFFEYYFKNAKLFNKKLKAKDYGMKGQYSEENLAILNRMWEALPNSMKLQFAGNIQEGRSSYNKRMERIESDSMNPIVALFNGFYEEETSSSTGSGGARQSSQRTKKGRRKRSTTNARKATGTFNEKVDLDEKELKQISQKIYENNLDIDDSIFGESFAKSKTGKKLQRPGFIAANILNKVDDYLYTFIFGDDKFDKEKEDNGFFNAMINRMKESFEKFELWMDQNILIPIKDRFTKQSIHDAAQSFFGLFGIDLDTMVDKTKEFLFGNRNKKDGLLSGFFSEVKKNFGGVKDYIKNSFFDVFDYFGIRGEKNEKGKAKEAREKKRRSTLSRFNKNIRNKDIDNSKAINDAKKGMKRYQSKYNVSDDGVGSVEPIDNAAEGIGRVSKTGVIAVSEGELIIPPDLNPFNIKKRYQAENKAKDRFMRSIRNFAEGGVTGEEDKEIQDIRRKLHNDRVKYTRDDFVGDNVPLYMKMQDEFIKLISNFNQFNSELFGKVKGKMNDRKEKLGDDFANATKDVMANLKQYAPDVFTGGTIGAGVSLITGAIGGPLLGAAAGSAIALIKDSEQVRTWLFGNMEDGEYQGGLLSKDISNKINKYFPDMGKGATLGAITSILPFVPGGPVTGIIVGSAIGFAKNNDKITNALFGEDGLLPDFPEKVKKKLPKMGLGALAGLIGGPFGVTTNIILGSALGFASDTNKFKDIMFGYEGYDGKRAGGILGFVKGALKVPIDGMKKFFEDTIKWFKNSILEPIQRGFEPFVQQFKNIGKWIANRISNSFDNHVVKPIGSFLNERIIQPIEKVVGAILKVPLNAFKGLISMPFKAFGFAGDRLKEHQLKTVGAAGGNAATRIAERAKLDSNRKIRGPKLTNSYANKVDLFIDNLGDEQFDQVMAASNALDSRLFKKKSVNKIAEEFAISGGIDKRMTSHVEAGEMTRKEYKLIMNDVLNGQSENAIRIVNSNAALSNEVKKTMIKDIKDSAKKRNEAFEAASNAQQVRQEFMDKTGIDISRSEFKDVMESEYKYRSKNNHERGEGYINATNELVSEATIDQNAKAFKVAFALDEKHKEVLDVLKKIENDLYTMAYPQARASMQRKMKEQPLMLEDKQMKQSSANAQTAQNNGRIIEMVQTEDGRFLPSVSGDIIDGEYRQVAASARGGRLSGLTNKAGILFGSAKQKANSALNFVKSKIAGQNGESDVDTADLKEAAKDTKEDENVKWDFSQGYPAKYIRSKDSNWHLDKSNTETVIGQKKAEEQRNTQKGILSTLTSLPGKIFSFFGGKKNSEEGEEEEGFLSKMLKTAGKVAMVGALIAFAPKIVDILKTHVLPIFTDFKDGFLSGWNHTGEQLDTLPEKIGSFIGDHLNTGITYVKDFLLSEGQFEGKGLGYVFEDKILPGMLTGFEFLLSKVVPKAVEIIIKNLPNIIWSGVKGLGGFFKSAINGIFNPDGERKDYDAESRNDTTTVTDTINVDSGNINYKPSSSWDIKGSTTTVKTTGGGTGAGSSTMEERTKRSKEVAGAAFGRGERSVGGTALGALSKAALTGSGAGTALRGLGKASSWLGKATSKTIGRLPYGGFLGKITGGALDVAGKALSKFGTATDKAGALGQKILPTSITRSTKEVAEDAVEGAASKAVSATTNATQASKAATNAKGVKGLKQKIGQKISDVGSAAFDKVKSKAANLVKEENNGLISKFVAKVKNLIIDLFKNSKLVNFIKDKAEKAGQKFSQEALEQSLTKMGQELAEKLTAKLGQAAGKAVAKMSAKIAALVGTGGLATIFFAVTGFISGWNKADEYLNIENPSFLQKLISGAVTAINDSFCLGLLPIEFLFDCVLKVAQHLPMFKDAVEDIKTQQAELQAKVDQYNLEHGTNLTIDEYLAKDKFGTKVKNAAGKAISGVKSFFGFGKDKDEEETASDTRKVTKEAIDVMTPAAQEKTTETGTLTATASGIATKDATNIMMAYTTDETTSSEQETTSITSSAYSAEIVCKSIVNIIPDYLAKIYYALTKAKESKNLSISERGKEYSRTSGDIISNITTRSLINVNDSIVGLTKNMDKSLETIDDEHELNKKNLVKGNLKTYWKTKTSNLGNGDDIASTLAHFITFYEKAMLFPMTLMNNTLALSGDAVTNGTGSTSSSSSSSTQSASDGSSQSSNIGKGNAVTRVISKAVNGVKNFASGIWSGIKSIFGKGSGITGSGSSMPNPKIRESEKGLLSNSIEGNPSVQEQDRIEFYGLQNPSRSERMQKEKGYFISQIDSPYSSRSFNIEGETEKETVADAGCAPAAATMAINLANKLGNTKDTRTFKTSISNALNYKAKDDGVTADYFIDEFERSGLSTAFVSGQQPNMSDTITNMLKEQRPVVLLGQDESNTSKRYSPFGPEGHYVVATGISSDGKYIYINDPESKKPNMVYPIESVLSHVTLGMAPMPKNAKMDAKVRNSKVRDYMKQYRGRALEGSSNREKIWNFLTGNGCSAEVAAGIIGNLMQEASTTVDPALHQSGGPGRGICQWTEGSDRWQGLQSVASSMGVSWTDLGAQCTFMWQEIQSESTWVSLLKSRYGLSVQDFLKLTDIDKATRIFCTCFERAGNAQMSNRISYAKKTYEEFKGQVGSGGGATVNVSFPKYNLTDDQINRIACTLPKEQVTEKGWSDEASLMANLTDINGDEKATPENLIKTITGSWFAQVTRDAYHAGGTPEPGTVDVVKRVLVEGKRTLPRYVNEHDCFSDINYAANNGSEFDPNDRSKYQQNVTQVKNNYGSEYTFYRFPSDQDDPFGYTDDSLREKWGEGYYDYSGSAVGSNNGGSSGGTTESSEPAWKNPKSILDLFTVFDDLAAAWGLNPSSSSSSGSSSSGSSSTGTASGTGSEKQKALANAFIKSENAIQTYSQGDRYNFTVADDGTISGSAIDCSAAVQKVYEKLLGVDPGSWTGAQATDDDLVTIEQGSGSPGSSGPTLSKMQLGDIVLYGDQGGTHVEMFTGKSDKGYTMGAGSAPAPHWDKGTDSGGKLSDWHTQNSGFWSVRRWKGFENGSDTTVTGSGSGLLRKTGSRKQNNPVHRVISGKGTRRSNSRVENIIRKFSGKGTGSGSSMPKIPTSSTTTTSRPMYNYTRSSDGTEVYETTVNNTNVSSSTNSNSEQLIEMLKAIVKILVRIVDNSDNMKQIVALLTQLVTVVSTTTDDGTTTKEQKQADASALKLNLLNTLNSATSSNPDKELLDIINNMESLASL